MSAVRKSVLETIQQYEMIRPGDCVLVGFSGGADSLCLLVTLWELSAELEITVSALHVHHGLRGDAADRDAAFAEEFCQARGIPYAVRHVDTKARTKETGESLEEAARSLRYEALSERAEEIGASRIAVAHHENDSAETLLFHLIRGSALRGLSGIPPVRGKIIRPLLFCSKDEILRDLQERGLSYCEDETNDSDMATRNRIRRDVLPNLAEIRPDAAKKIAETGAYLSEVDAYLTKEARKKLDEFPARDGSGIDAALLSKAPGIMQEYLIATYLRNRGCSMKDMTREHLQKIAALSDLPVGKGIDLPSGLRAERSYDSVRIFPKNGTETEKTTDNSAVSMHIRVFSRVENEDFPEKEYTKWFDCDKINRSPVLRTRSPGDRIAVSAGQHKKLSDWMIDEKIPKQKRDSVLLVADGPDILWAVGYRMGADAKITADTVLIMEITIEGRSEE